MDKKEREKISRQLIAQADLIVNEEDDVQVLAEAVNTCQALLRIVDKNISNDITNSDFEDVLSGYVGLTSRIKYFYQNNSEYVSDSNSKLLNDLLSDISEFQRRKSDLDVEYEKKMDETKRLKSEVDELEKKAEKVNHTFQSVNSVHESLLKEIDELTTKTNMLKEEESNLRKEVDDFEPRIEKLTDSIKELNEQYQELTAYYTEFERVKEGIREEGYVDMEDFVRKIHTQIESGNELMRWCDRTLKALMTDIESLQEKIEKKRKAGA